MERQGQAAAAASTAFASEGQWRMGELGLGVAIIYITQIEYWADVACLNYWAAQVCLDWANVACFHY